MTNELIEKLIDQINQNDHLDYIFLRPLTDSIQIAKVWPRPIEDEIIPVQTGYDFYFIYKNNGHCVGAALDMGDRDLHLFVKAEYRRQGIMRNAMQSAILPHLRSKGRKEQSVTYQTNEARRFIESLEFTHKMDGSSSISLMNFPELPSLKDSNTTLPEFRIKDMQKRIWIASGLVRMVMEEAQGALNEATCNHLDEVAHELNDLGHSVENAWWKAKPPTDDGK